MLLDGCLQGAPRAWEDFVDRFLGLVTHVANHTAGARGMPLDSATRDDLVAEVFLKLIDNDFAVLRRFRRQCSLATYLAVVARRVIVRRINRDWRSGTMAAEATTASSVLPAEVRIDDRDHVELLLTRLNGRDAEIVRMYHLEGKSYREISDHVGVAENTIGPTLSRARAQMRE